MPEHGRLGIRQLTILTIMIVMGDMMMIYPSVIASFSGQNAWLNAFIGIPLGMGLMYLYVKLADTYPGENLFGIFKKILGFWPGTLLSLIYLMYFIFGSSTQARVVGDFMTSEIFMFTPIRVVLLIFYIVIGWGIYNGLETIGRSSEILLPIVTVFMFVLVICLLPQTDLDQLRPFTDTNMQQISKGLMVSFIYPVGEAIPILMLLPYSSQQAHRTRDLVIGAGFGNFLMAVLVTISLLVMGLFLTQHSIFGSFVLAQKINIANFFQRIEVLMASSWLISTYFKSTIYLYAFIVGTAELFGFKASRFLVLPSVLSAFALSNIVSPTLSFIVTLAIPYWLEWDITLCLIFPVMLLIIHQIKSKMKLKKGMA
ncbi:endospore germination permease [Paenibacillus barcinonensis]|uniref:Endospore germination permease n=1 Tax=Paenibacillus barcinonensis TaxID=198119 RepID=A0A2V4V4U0_PAEBA|nr:endospore germination permease [Paenibacillus barcinonensis]PYE43836.1 spore germination protein KB [Paenibacillus barcinonensis]QKS58426.1 endospore germination permease [Paenibacillus barcinonensis]